MKTADIKVGETYAYRWSSYATPRPAEVLETGIEQFVGRRYAAKTAKTGVRVRITDATGHVTEQVVASRTIGPDTWAQFSEREAARMAQRKAAADRKTAEEAHRAALALRVESVFKAHGEPVLRQSISPGEAVVLEAAGFYVVSAGQNLYTMIVRSPVPGLRDFVFRSKADPRVVEVLLAEAGA